jgi:hypothetical protein
MLRIQQFLFVQILMTVLQVHVYTLRTVQIYNKISVVNANLVGKGKRAMKVSKSVFYQTIYVCPMQMDDILYGTAQQDLVNVTFGKENVSQFCFFDCKYKPAAHKEKQPV